jgi:hypothetical protein
MTNELDGYDDVANDSNGKPKAIRRMFELGALRLDIALNSNKLKPIVQGLEDARNALITELSGGGKELTVADNPTGFARLESEVRKMLLAEHDVDLKQMKRSSLKLDVNPIAVQALMILEDSGLLTD